MTNAAEIVIDTIAGRTFRATRRTFAHLEWTIERLADDYPRAQLVIIQPCYNTGVAASAGTHDKDAVFDVQIVGMSWQDAQTLLRKHGWAAWWRYPPAFGNHIHMVSLGYVGAVGIYVPGQVADYYAHRSGLAGHVADNAWHPKDIDSTIFNYQEDDMFNDADRTLLTETRDAALKAAKESAQARVGSYRRDVRLKAKLRQVGIDAAKVDKVLAELDDEG